MLEIVHIRQPGPNGAYAALLGSALGSAAFADLCFAFAYATHSGVRALAPAVESSPAAKRWLVALDWCRSEPWALDSLGMMPQSEVRVPDGHTTVASPGCAPHLPFHPKAVVARSSDAIAVVTGSGNLSRNGLTRGHEAATLVAVHRPRTQAERDAWTSCLGMATWFDSLWQAAPGYAAVADEYRRRYAELQQIASPTPTDEDEASRFTTRGMTAERLRLLRACEYLWIDAGNLHANRGAGRPGNQLMMSPGTRAYFGFGAEPLPRDTTLGHVSIEYAGQLRTDCSLRFSNNSMDVLTLPVPNNGGPPKYDGERVRFRKVANGSGLKFELALASGQDGMRWESASKRVKGSFAMTSGRQWGVF